MWIASWSRNHHSFFDDTMLQEKVLDGLYEIAIRFPRSKSLHFVPEITELAIEGRMRLTCTFEESTLKQCHAEVFDGGATELFDPHPNCVQSSSKGIRGFFALVETLPQSPKGRRTSPAPSGSGDFCHFVRHARPYIGGSSPGLI